MSGRGTARAGFVADAKAWPGLRLRTRKKAAKPSCRPMRSPRLDAADVGPTTITTRLGIPRSSVYRVAGQGAGRRLIWWRGDRPALGRQGRREFVFAPVCFGRMARPATNTTGRAPSPYSWHLPWIPAIALARSWPALAPVGGQVGQPPSLDRSRYPASAAWQPPPSRLYPCEKCMAKNGHGRTGPYR